MEWKKFSEPFTWHWLWVSDYKTVWLRHVSALESRDYDCVWAEAKIDYPEPPNGFHRCVEGCMECFEDEQGLFLEYDGTQWNIEYCPFCGYKCKD